jgi:hypothetical protein
MTKLMARDISLCVFDVAAFYVSLSLSHFLSRAGKKDFSHIRQKQKFGNVKLFK